MLKVKTEEQKARIEEILGDTSIWTDDGVVDGLHIDDWVSFDRLAELIDYLRSINKPKKKELDMSIVAPNMLEPVETWLAYKKEKAQSYKPTGFKTFYKKLCELSGNNPQVAMAIIEQSMSNNYAGIFPLKNNNNNYGRETVTDRIKRTLANAEEFKKRIDASIGKQAEMDFGDEKDVW